MFSPSPRYNVVGISRLSTRAIFPKLKLGEGGLGTRDWELQCIPRYNRDFRNVNLTAYLIFC